MTVRFSGLAFACATALTACQVETTNQVAQTAPKSEPMIEATPSAPARAVTMLSQTTMLSGRAVADGIEWRGRGSNMGPRSGVFFAATAMNIGGETAICGVQARRGVGSTRFNSQVANAFTFVIGTETVLRNVAYFSRASSIEAFGETPAACKSTGIPWKAEYAKAPWALRYTGGSKFSF